ncbi:galactosamine-6-phosphate isomerase [Rhodocytophaga rosea]|uniref:Galactosamine-6-phosphate isomerase n=1 Tax=Rhodocytophaga rosea TaxID=2704465 RepID=A0A6C0GKG8_9BACT|nr:galactosamine-6-phosphate isomerase [Rhodocytophaga rosea]QHT68459.1 galactosamine-6-phosphate isomerase [Rhodocytophaga rosea]
MNIIHCRDYEEMSGKAATLVIQEVERKKNLLLCAATGNSPTGFYAKLVEKSEKDKIFFDQLKVIKLDEWGGIPENHPSSCEYYLQTKLVEPLRIPPERYISFQSNPTDPAAECARIQAELDTQGPIDLCILGIGANGHIGFNEPALFLEPHCHIARLSGHSLTHTMVQSLNDKPTYGLTLGLQDIMRSRKIILLISGKNKEQIIQEFLSGKITTRLPASLLWLHPDVDCLIGI